MDLRVLFFGDIVGKIGRKAFRQILPDLKKELRPDFIIANIENIAHGSGLTKKTLKEVEGVDAFTTGNHVFKKDEAREILSYKNSPVLRPYNLKGNLPGEGARIFTVKGKNILLINLLGQVFMHEEYDNPFLALDEILLSFKSKNIDISIVDFHAEATSEKTAFGHYADGRIGAVIGTHTHIPTADNHLLAKGTAYVTDAGMVGAKDSVIGQSKDAVLKSFISDVPFGFNIPEKGQVQVNSMLITFGQCSNLAKKFVRIDREVNLC
ncbi:YmdB family metallophosphoesterase [Candidatus Parcubacteria bacterium]|nr:MAG: YmdB family metallophosphoesterase [Candidatus Parcubacteria bacterium]